MREYRVPLAVAIPAAIGVIAVLWILRRKSGRDKRASNKPKVSEKDQDVPKVESSSEAVATNCTLGGEKEGITITQRKIPETQARDRGDSDLGHRAPDCTAGADHRKPAATSSLEGKPIVEDETALDDFNLNRSFTQVQIEQVEKMIISAMADGLHEATGKLGSTKMCKASEPDTIESLSPSVSSGIEVSESFDQLYHDTLTTSIDLLPSEKVIACSSVATIGFDVEEKPLQDGCLSSTEKEFLISEAAARPSSEPCQPELSHEPCSEAAAKDEAQSSLPQGKAMDIGCVEEAVLSSVQSQLTSEQVVVGDLTRDQQSLNQNPPQSPFPSSQTTANQTLPQEVQPTQQEQDRSVSVLADTKPPASAATRRRMPALSSGSLESQASLDPEDIDSLWGIKPLSGASANWDKQLSLDDPSSPLRKQAVVTEETSEAVASSTVTDLSSESQAGLNTERLIEAEEESSLASLPSKEDSDSRRDNDVEPPQKAVSPLCDSHSEGSNDSGRGGSEHEAAQGGGGDSIIQFDFNMPADLCGRFIGRHGKNINYLKSKTGASISLTNNPFTAEFQICQVAGSQTEVDSVLAMIRRKFPLQDFPLLTMVPININPNAATNGSESQPVIVPDVMQLSLPEGVSVEVYVSAIVDAGHVFVQQPTHRSFMSLEKLTYHLNAVYDQDPNVPAVPTPVECGVICVVESEGCWYRAMIMSQEDENGEAQVKFVDFGGYASLPVPALKQIRTDFMTLPFQAVECFMANITPLQGADYFSEEATNTLSDMTSMKLLQCQVVARSETGIPYIHLYQISPEMNTAVLINRALVSNEQAQWVEIL
ncbi:A kinase anchor protein 1, mitochondrial [Plakobranchus ocellatus]|uniref:A kinase anchor protein 1, mitochondrial n=1 Tax=Plakobranchus ocellatus TaxID=259542 RepID=A0AAV3ZZ75_9GAST|nr:A kinase anchor protein 1, mitochondrial [Plakobranchus ocellatus]